MLAILLTSATMLASPGADDPPSPQYNLVGSAPSLCMLMDNPQIHEELGLDHDQVRSCMLLVERSRNQRIASIREARTSRPSSGEKPLDPRAEQAARTAETVETIGKILKPDQLARFKQIALQAGTVATFLDPSVKQALKLDDGQVAALVKIQNEARRTIQNEMKAGKLGREEIARKALALRQEGRARAFDLLTDEQRATWDAMVGKPFFTGDESPRDVTPKKEIRG